MNPFNLGGVLAILFYGKRFASTYSPERVFEFCISLKDLNDQRSFVLHEQDTLFLVQLNSR